ncbi:DNA cytosine methyltransferase [Yersinia proxima]|uniref:DNA cytosine methyltransferase n=1 Tax=Yersinia proxima TaxID=2890316 RepID=UPI001D11225C|nr:DNA (cytosine-5-)-methyltransferase [Yersinia proxima]
MTNIKKTNKNIYNKKINSFFSGIGGFDLAFEKNGFVPTFFCENNAFCRNVLEKNWQGIKISKDISQLNVSEIPEAGIWTAGFPCQDLSLARTPHGTRNGLKGSQSGLFFTFLDLVSQHLPQVVLLENVAGLLNSHKGADFNTLIKSLTRLGYAVAWRVLNARYFGAPQSRPRVFICAWKGSPSNAIETLFENEIVPIPKQERKGFLTESKCPVSGISVAQLSYCISATSGRHTGLDWARTYVTYPRAVRRLTPLECERLQGFPDNWTIPNINGVTSMRSFESNRYHAIGNAVCVPVVEWIAKRISKILDNKSSQLKNIDENCIEEHLKSLVGTHISAQNEIRNFSDKEIDLKWKSGGLAFGDFFATMPVSSAPQKAITSMLIDVIDKNITDDIYFLSPNAIQGILRRVDKLGRNLFPPLDSVLRKIYQQHNTDSEKFIRSETTVTPIKQIAI